MSIKRKMMTSRKFEENMTAEHQGSHITIEGPAIFLHGVEPPAIPIEHGRECPQCGATAWLRSRYCWSCDFDFEAASLPGMHPVKLLWASVALNFVTAGLLLWKTLGSFMTAPH